MRIRSRGLVCLALLAVALASLGPSSAGAPLSTAVAAVPDVAQQTTLRVGYLPITGNLDVVVARERGIFRDEGLNVELTAMAGGAEILPALIGGSLDLGTLNALTHILALDQGFRARAVAGVFAVRRGDPLHAILVRADSQILSARDLEGKTLATNTLNNIDHLMQQVWLRQQGADPRRVSFVEIPFPQMPAALAQSRVDAIGPAEPFVQIAASQGARILAHHYTDVNEVTLLAYYGATDDWLNRNPDLARRFARAVQRADDMLFGNRAEFQAAAVQYLNMDPNLAARVGFGESVRTLDPALVRWWIDTAREYGLISNNLDPADFMYDTVR